MATLYIGEYADIGSTNRGSVAIPLEPPANEQSVPIGALSAQSAELKDTTCIVKLESDVDCAVAVGPDPDATGSVRRLVAGREQYLSVPHGAKLKVAVIALSSGVASSFDTLEALLRLVASPDAAKAQLALLAAQTLDLQTAANDLRGMDAANKATLVAIENATSAHNATLAEAAASSADLEARRVALQADTELKLAGINARAAEVAQALDAQTARAAGLEARSTALDAIVARQTAAAAALDAREQDLTTREAALAAGQADYADRVAKLKALTG